MKRIQPMSFLDEFTGNLSLNTIPNNHTYSGTIYHYTSSKNLESILFNGKSNSTLWSSRYDCLNDVSEGSILEKRYKESCDELLTEGLISDDMYKLFVSIVPSRNETFLIPRDDGSLKAERLECDIYVTSFSKEYDLLAMWNYYSKGNMYEGVNIGFSALELKKSVESYFPKGKVICEVCPVFYEENEQKQLIKEVLLEINKKQHLAKDDSSIRATISMKLTSWKMLFKNSHFNHEKEVRLILKVPRKYKNEFDIKYRNYLGLIIPYIEIKCDRTSISQVTLGPILGNENQKESQRRILHEMLTEKGYNVVEKISSIPIRY